jgi:ATP-dependent helicase/nuclease subunit A
VKHWTTQGDERGRRWNASDVLILVRKRGPAFEAVIRALRQAGVAVAGADRIEIGEHIAVLDLVAAGRAALLPDDDLTLAVALKSPLVGLDDDDLLRSQGPGRARNRSLPRSAATRRRRRGGGARGRGGRGVATLAGRHGPFGFYATLLGPMDGRAKLVRGSAARPATRSTRSSASPTEFERAEAASLTTFLARFEQASHPIKRDLDAKRDEVRVMTVHGAKGPRGADRHRDRRLRGVGPAPDARSSPDPHRVRGRRIDARVVLRQGRRLRARRPPPARRCTKRTSRSTTGSSMWR